MEQSSQLCGKLFDETGDRLTPSHTKTKKGRRLRYYVSHRLIAKSGEAHLDGWRLPAPELEDKVAQCVKALLAEPGHAAKICPGVSTDEIAKLRQVLSSFAEERSTADLLSLVARIDLSPGSMKIDLIRVEIADAFHIDADRIDPVALRIAAPFQIRKRGVETKLILGEMATHVDETLLRNIAKAHHWFAQIKTGKTFAEIAALEDTSKRRIQQMIDLAFLAPDLIRDVLDGKQPVGFTSDWCKQHCLPSDWHEQRALLATL